MRENDRIYLIRTYQEKKGKKGSLMELINHFRDEIDQMASKNYSPNRITQEIENIINYDFKQGQVVNPLLQSVRSYLSSKGGKEKPKISKPIITSRDYGEEPDFDIIEEEKPKKEDNRRSHLQPPIKHQIDTSIFKK